MRPFSLLIKPAGPDCNLACDYCFYSHKTDLFTPGRHHMPDNVLEKVIGDYLQLEFPQSSFAWQGGEPTMMGLDFYRRVVELQQQHGHSGQSIANALQTNAVLLDESWCRFLHEYNFLVGISLDGPRHFHNHYRKNHLGEGSFEKVMAAINLCRAHHVEFNILTLLNNKNVQAPDELFDFFLENQFKFLQFIPCIERDRQTNQKAPFSVTSEQYGDFLCRIFDRWLEFGPRKISIRLFDSILSFILQGRHTNCTFGQRCNDYIVIEHNGDAFCCDFFVTDEWNLGNVLERPIKELFESDIKDRFSRLKRKLANKCLVCRHNPICRGGCLKDRIALTDDYSQPSYFCNAYRQFFDHALPKLHEIAAHIAQNQRTGPSKKT